MTTLWLSILTILVLLQGYVIRELRKDIENLESWKIISKIRIPDDDVKGGAEQK